MRILKFLPDRQYGFAIDDQGRQAFFPQGHFTPGAHDDPHPGCGTCPGEPSCPLRAMPAPPILGEAVEVTVAGDLDGARAPKASRVLRLDKPRAMTGRVEDFDAGRGYGFIAAEDGTTLYLHRSEVLDGRLPLVGAPVAFYVGERQGRPRACHVRICQ